MYAYVLWCNRDVRKGWGQYKDVSVSKSEFHVGRESSGDADEEPEVPLPGPTEDGRGRSSRYTWLSKYLPILILFFFPLSPSRFLSLSLSLSFSLNLSLSIYLSVYLFIYLSIFLSLLLSVIYIYTSFSLKIIEKRQRLAFI